VDGAHEADAGRNVHRWDVLAGVDQHIAEATRPAAVRVEHVDVSRLSEDGEVVERCGGLMAEDRVRMQDRECVDAREVTLPGS